MSRFVLLLHECPLGIPRQSHCDLMLEAGGVLLTWALVELPCDWARVLSSQETCHFAATNTVDVERLADHRLAYLDYEGPVSGNRGKVRRLDAGSYETRRELPESLEITLAGNSVRGEILFERTNLQGARWRLSYRSPPTV